MTSRRVVVTGMGALTPIGNDLESYWNGLISGTSGCANITYFDASKFKTKFACEIKGFDPADHFEKKEFRRYDRFSQYGIVAASEAIDDSKLIDSSPNYDRIGVKFFANKINYIIIVYPQYRISIITNTQYTQPEPILISVLGLP